MNTAAKMPTPPADNVINKDTQLDKTYKYGFSSDIEMDYAPKGLNEDIVRLISEKKGEPEWMLEWREFLHIFNSFVYPPNLITVDH